MNAMQVVGIALAAFSVGPFIILIGACRNVRGELRETDIREPAPHVLGLRRRFCGRPDGSPLRLALFEPELKNRIFGKGSFALR